MIATPRKATAEPRKAVASPKPATAKPATGKTPAPAARPSTAPRARAKQPPVADGGTQKAAKTEPKRATRRQKTVRDSFNMPAEDYALIAAMKQRALSVATEVKKSELLRAGLRILAALGNEQFKAALATVPAVKTGRPGKKHKKK
jgi:hypothetical protein